LTIAVSLADFETPVLLYTLAAVQINEIRASDTSPSIKRRVVDVRRSDAFLGPKEPGLSGTADDGRPIFCLECL